KAAERLRACEKLVEIVHHEIERLRSRVRLTNRRDVDHLQCHRATREVTARARLLASRDAKECGIEVHGLIKVSDLDIDPKEAGHVRRRAFLRSLWRCFACSFLLRCHLPSPSQ